MAIFVKLGPEITRPQITGVKRGQNRLGLLFSLKSPQITSKTKCNKNLKEVGIFLATLFSMLLIG